MSQDNESLHWIEVIRQLMTELLPLTYMMERVKHQISQTVSRRDMGPLLLIIFCHDLENDLKVKGQGQTLFLLHL